MLTLDSLYFYYSTIYNRAIGIFGLRTYVSNLTCVLMRNKLDRKFEILAPPEAHFIIFKSKNSSSLLRVMLCIKLRSLSTFDFSPTKKGQKKRKLILPLNFIDTREASMHAMDEHFCASNKAIYWICAIFTINFNCRKLKR